MEKERDKSKTLSIVLFVFIVFFNAFPVFGQPTPLLVDVNGANLFTIVINNIPYKNCGDWTSIDTLSTTELLARYKTDFIDKFHQLPNAWIYMDISNPSLLGWESSFTQMIDLLYNTVYNTSYGLLSIAGFASNVAGYIPLEEQLLPDPQLVVGGEPIYKSRFYDYNPYICELKYVEDMYTALVLKGFPYSIGMLIDTSRNGWGGPNRPAKVSTSTDTNTYVDESRSDRRYHRMNWCSQGIAGIGARPQANPAPHIHAFVWIKPPGISDGMSNNSSNPLDPQKKLSQWCMPGNVNPFCACGNNGAMSDAPYRWLWHEEQFKVLLANAYPPL